MHKSSIPPIYVINLKRSIERRKFISEQLENLNLEYKIFEAIDGGNISPEDMKLYSREKAISCSGISLISAEIACALSHIKMWELIIKNNYDRCVILEDDTIIGESFKSFLQNLHKLPPEWEMINLCTDARLKTFGDFIFDNHKLGIPINQPNRSNAYLINPKGIKKLLAKVYPIRYSTDNFMRRTKLTGLLYYGLYPQIAGFNENFRSVIWWETPNSEKIQKSLYYRIYQVYILVFHFYSKKRDELLRFLNIKRS